MRNRASSSENTSTIVEGSATAQRPISKLFTVPIDGVGAQTTVERNPPKRTPSARTPGFTTRRPQSIKKMCHWDDLKSIDMHG